MRRWLAVLGAALLLAGAGAGAQEAAPVGGPCDGVSCDGARPAGAAGGAAVDETAGGTSADGAGFGPGSLDAAGRAGIASDPVLAPAVPLAGGGWDAPGLSHAEALDAPPALDPAAGLDPCPFLAADPIRLGRLTAIAGRDAPSAEAPFRVPQTRRCGG